VSKTDGHFKDRVYEIVASIPEGRVMTYGQIAAMCGSPRAARQVGGVAHYGPEDLPWHRVVNKQGGLASGYYGGKEGHKKDLQDEGFKVNENYTIDINKYIFWPDEE
jgi:methylated-DNA-protein-cysteine methyltransferase-like protein